MSAQTIAYIVSPTKFQCKLRTSSLVEEIIAFPWFQVTYILYPLLGKVKRAGFS